MSEEFDEVVAIGGERIEIVDVPPELLKRVREFIKERIDAHRFAISAETSLGRFNFYVDVEHGVIRRCWRERVRVQPGP